MPRFRYKAVNAAGVVVEGEMEAPARAAVIDRLRGDGHTPIRADEVQRRAATASRALLSFGRGRLSASDVALLTRELATLLKAGLPLDRALAILSELDEAGAKRAFVERVLDGVRGGASLADSLEPFKESLPGYYIGLVRAGEAGGTLEGVLARLADALERTQALKDSVRSAMYYPMIVLGVAGLSLVVLLTLVVPEFRPLFEDTGAAMPISMQVIVAFGDAVRQFWWLILIGIVLAVLLVRRHNRQPAGRLRRDRMLLRTPLVGDLVLKVEVARFTRTLGTLLANGVTALNALAIATGTLGNRALAQAVDGLGARLKRGEGLARPMQDLGVFPRLAVQLIEVGEESGQLEAMLLRVADIYDDEVKRSVQKLLALLLPVVTIGLGLLVAGIIASMLTAILSAYDLPL